MPRGASEQQSSLKVRKTFGLSFAGERDSKTSDDPVIFGLGCTVGKRTAIYGRHISVFLQQTRTCLGQSTVHLRGGPLPPAN